MDFEKAIELLTEFNYKKNGKEDTIKFLLYVLNELVNEGK